MQRYPIYEHFYSFQGEGVHMGRAAYFVRLYGCDVHCPWCDSAGTWHKDWRPDSVAMMTAEEVAALVDPAAEFVVITGGEPLLYPLKPLVQAINKPIHVETAGHRKPDCKVDWLTVSPKLYYRKPNPITMEQASEYKFIIDSEEALDKLWQLTAPYYNGAPIWLHPEWSQRSNPDILRLIVAAVKHPPYPAKFRAGWQLHKLYMADNLDPNARREAVPLGGDPWKGMPF